MDWLEGEGGIAPESRVNLLGNALVVVGRGDPIDPLESLPARLGEGRIALALTNSVPAGIYARAALEALGLWEPLAALIVETDNVRAALTLARFQSLQHHLRPLDHRPRQPRQARHLFEHDGVQPRPAFSVSGERLKGATIGTATRRIKSPTASPMTWPPATKDAHLRPRE